MPFLRFSRDKRGYENTYVLHGFRRGSGSRPKVLYWFRTPPNVRIGRLPLDEEAIRAIEENNTDLSFDWRKMLKVRQRPIAGARSERDTRVARKRRTSSRSVDSTVAPIRTVEEPEIIERFSSGVDRQDRDQVVTGPAGEIDPPGAEVLHEYVEPDEAEGESDRPWQHPVVALIGDNGLARLRARYAELNARISEKFSDSSAREAMRVRVEALNPDAWRAGEQAVHGIERFEAGVEDIKKTLGRRRSRRRGPRRRRTNPPA